MALLCGTACLLAVPEVRLKSARRESTVRPAAGTARDRSLLCMPTGRFVSEVAACQGGAGALF